MEKVEHDLSQKRFLINMDGAQAVMRYKLFENESGVTVIDFTSTFVPPEFRGKGLAEKLVREGLKWAKEQNYELQASCWYVATFIR